MKANVLGPSGRLYADPRNQPDETSFQVDNTSAAYYQSPYYMAHKAQVQSIPARRTGLSNDIDNCCKGAGLWPDLVLAGHAHLYQRFTRKMPDGTAIPYLVAGCGGFAATRPMQGLPKAPTTVGDHTLVINPIVDFGYLTVTVDANKKQLAVIFNQVGTKGGKRTGDQVIVDLAKRAIVKGA